MKSPGFLAVCFLTFVVATTLSLVRAQEPSASPSPSADAAIAPSLSDVHVQSEERGAKGTEIKKIWIDVAAFIVAFASFLFSLWTRRSDKRWKADVELRRPFNAELQKLTLLVAQSEGVLHRYKWETDDLARQLTLIERWPKPHPTLEELPGGLAQIRKALAATAEATQRTKTRMQQWWLVKAPSETDFAEAQRYSAEHAALMQRLQTALERAKEIFGIAFSVQPDSSSSLVGLEKPKK